jgi:hypothetical protein
MKATWWLLWLTLCAGSGCVTLASVLDLSSTPPAPVAAAPAAPPKTLPTPMLRKRLRRYSASWIAIRSGSHRRRPRQRKRNRCFEVSCRLTSRVHELVLGMTDRQDGAGRLADDFLAHTSHQHVHQS